MDGSQSAHGDKRVVRCTTRNCGPRPFESLRALTLVPGHWPEWGKPRPYAVVSSSSPSNSAHVAVISPLPPPKESG